MGRKKLPVPMSSVGCKTIRKMETAFYLIAGGVRPINVQFASRLDKKYLANLWQEMHGFPARGKTPLFAHSMMKSNHDAKEGALFIQVMQLYEKGGSLHDPAFFLQAYHQFVAITFDRRLSMEKLFYIWRDYMRGHLRLQTCTKCHGQYVYSSHHEAPDTLRQCQICNTRKIHRKGRRKSSEKIEEMPLGIMSS